MAKIPAFRVFEKASNPSSSMTEESDVYVIVCAKCGETKDLSHIISDCLVPGPGDKHFTFLCASCNKGKPKVTHLQKSWEEIVLTVLFNMSMTTGHSYFTLSELKEFVKRNQERLGLSFDGGNWESLQTAMKARPDLFDCSGGHWRLRVGPSEGGEPASQSQSGQDYSDQASDDSDARKYRDDDYGTPRRKQRSRSKRDEDRFVKRRVDKPSEWCHQCKQKHDNIFRCCSQDCTKKYCIKCLQRHYGEKETEIDPDNWACVYCRQLCCCACCRKKKAKATNTEFESKRGKKRTMRSRDRDGKRRRLGQNSASTEDSDDFVEEDEDHLDEEEFVSVTPTSSGALLPATRSAPVEYRNSSRNVSLKDLIDAGLLASGDEMCFKRSNEFSGILLSDGQIACGEHVCGSLSTFAKYAAGELQTKWSRQNGWRLIYCRSKCLNEWRKEYLESTRYLRPDCVDTIDEELPRFATPRPLEVRACRRNSNSICYDEGDDFYGAEENAEDDQSEDSSVVAPPVQEKIQLSTNYNWLQYELQHALEYIHGAPIFADYRFPFDSEHTSQDALDFDIRDKDFFPVTGCDEGAKCC